MKKIEIVEMKAADIKHDFGNPRKITKKEREKLKKSIADYGDFGIFIIDENDNIIGGNQRLDVLLETDPEAVVTCKRLIGYDEAELRYVNIKDNSHAGEWDLDLLAEWTADLTLDLGIDPKPENTEERKIDEMELVKFEKYDYVIIACRNELDYNNLVRSLGIEGKKVPVHEKRKIKARAIWYDEMKAQILPAGD